MSDARDLPTMEAQARSLRATIDRRRKVQGANNHSDDVCAIVAHYEQVLASLESDILESRRAMEMLSEQEEEGSKLLAHSRCSSRSTTCS